MEKEILMLTSPPEVVEHSTGKASSATDAPQINVWKYFIEEQCNMFVASWDCQAGTFTAKDRDNAELCFITEGEADIIDGAGNRYHVSKGDSFVLPVGLTVTWEVPRYVKKLYARVFA